MQRVRDYITRIKYVGHARDAFEDVATWKVIKVSPTFAGLSPPLHSPVVRLTCNQQVGDSNSSGGSTLYINNR